MQEKMIKVSPKHDFCHVLDFVTKQALKVGEGGFKRDAKNLEDLRELNHIRG